jgi:hypothetical protein
MPINEAEVFFENVNNFRKITLNEAEVAGVDSNIFVDAIENNKILYIYYNAPNLKLRGFRTIKPFVLGKTKSGNLVVRAWQETGTSNSFVGIGGRRRYKHEYHAAKTGTRTIKPGWRLFSLQYITSAIPTGERFSVNEKNVDDLYNPNDKQMKGGIIASIATQMGRPEQNPVIDSSSEFDTQTPKWKQFFKATEKKRDATPEEIKQWYNVAKNYKSKSPDKYMLVYTDYGQMVLKDVSDTNIPKESIVGNINDLYNNLMGNTGTMAPKPTTPTLPTTQVVNKQQEFTKNNSFTDKIHNEAIGHFDSIKNQNT